MSDQLFEINDENNMSFEYEGINNFEHNFDDNYNVFSDENDNYDETDDHTDNEEGNTVNFLPITSYFSPTSPTETSKKKAKTNVILKKGNKSSGPSWIWKYTRRDKLTRVKYCTVRIDNEDGTSERCKKVFQPKTSTTNIAAHLRTEHRIFKTQKWDASSTTTVNPTSVTQPTIETIIQKQIENTLPLPEKQQNRISYRLVAWIVEEMMPLNCINYDRFRDFCYEINQRFEIPCTNTIKNMMKESVFHTCAILKEMIRQTMASACITTDLWTQNHVPYIGITAHWLSENFTMYKSLITIEHFPYPHT
ncbi:3972_t:CDS:1, partial [Scutellospora calospora]